MLEFLTLVSSMLLESTKLQLLVVFSILYIIYYKKYGFYIFSQKKTYTIGKHRMGKTLPAYPNGWFMVARSEEVKKGESKFVDAHGESLVVFRGNNNKSYVLSAYCPHLGANLGVEGQVVNDSCIQCPFHAWIFDGETGACVVGKEKKEKEGIRYEYEFDCETNKCEFKQTKTERIKIRKYLSKESNGFIFVWFHAEEKEPHYEPFEVTDFQKRLSHRGTSMNMINAHASDIAENGGDMLHFIYIHSEIIPLLIKGYWDAKWVRADDPQLIQKMTLEDKSHNEFRMKLINRFINEKNKKSIGVLHLYNTISICGLPETSFFTLTGFQVGPGLVYLFIKGKFFETFLLQHIHTKDKYNQELYHEIYTDKWSPYWFSALQLRLEVRQVLNDGVVWDNKLFAHEAYFNKVANEKDGFLISWRQWYSQFYDGCNKEEEKKKSLNW